MKRGLLLPLFIVLALASAGLFAVLRGQNEAQVARAPNVRLVAVDGDFLLSEKRGEPLILYFSFVG